MIINLNLGYLVFNILHTLREDFQKADFILKNVVLYEIYLIVRTNYTDQENRTEWITLQKVNFRHPLHETESILAAFNSQTLIFTHKHLSHYL